MALAIYRLGYAGYRDRGMNYEITFDKDAGCAAKAAGTCFAQGRDVFCDKKRLARILATLAIVAGSMPVQRSERIESKPSFTMDTAMLLADAAIAQEDARTTQVIQTLSGTFQIPLDVLAGALYMMPALQNFDLENDPTLLSKAPNLAFQHPVFEGAVNYAIAYIVGHELTHAFGSCPFKKPSWSESSGTLARLSSLQSQRNGVLCQNNLLVDEIRADACALRVVEAMDVAMLEHKKKEALKLFNQFPSVLQSLHSMSRRLGLDAVSLILITGLGSDSKDSIIGRGPTNDDLPTIFLISKSSPGYPYAAIRTISLATLLHHLEPYNGNAVRICDNAARYVALNLNFARTHCRSSDRPPELGALARDFGEFLPVGVATAWKSGGWDDHSGGTFSCSTTPDR